MKALALLLIPAAARADIAEVFRLYQGKPGERSFVKTLVGGIADGFGAANYNLQENGRPKLYCAPEAIKLTDDQLIEILRIWVDANAVTSERNACVSTASAKFERGAEGKVASYLRAIADFAAFGKAMRTDLANVEFVVPADEPSLDQL